MAKLSVTAKLELTKFRNWQLDERGPSIDGLKVLDKAFQEAVMYFFHTGNTDQIRFMADAHLGKNKDRFIEYLIERLPFEYKDGGKTNFKVSTSWKDSFYTTAIRTLNPFTTIKFTRPKREKTGNIRLEKEYANLEELHSFILDCLVLYRKSFTNKQISELNETINKISPLKNFY